MKVSWKNYSVLFVVLSLILGIGVNAQAADKVRVALGDVASVETLCFIVALDRAKDRGVAYELTAFSKEELAIQAIINGQMDIGVGTPYSVIQKTSVPIRLFFQMSKLVFFPVVANEYKTWKDLDGQPFTFHARGTGTEAIGNIIAKRQGITFGQRSYVPGSENRIIAMMKGQIKATIVDLANKNLLMSKAGDRFHVLPGVDDPVTDEALFADVNWLKKNEKAVTILTEELLRTWREMIKDPTMMDRERKKRNLLTDLPKELLADVDKYYKEAVDGGLYDPDGGLNAAKSDFEFYVNAGQMKGPMESLKIEDYWYLDSLKAAMAKLGK
jgi:NitT/TauT family transport system substrate-binding protein